LESQSFLNTNYILKQQLEFKKVIISSVDRLHPKSGIKAKLEGYQHFLRNYPPMRSKTCLVQYTLPYQDESIAGT